MHYFLSKIQISAEHVYVVRYLDYSITLCTCDVTFGGHQNIFPYFCIAGKRKRNVFSYYQWATQGHQTAKID